MMYSFAYLRKRSGMYLCSNLYMGARGKCLHIKASDQRLIICVSRVKYFLSAVCNAIFWSLVHHASFLPCTFQHYSWSLNGSV
jgi:hypothetical protein